MKIPVLIAGASLVCALSSAAHAAAFSNGSFETFVAADAYVTCLPGGIDFCGQYNAGNTGITGWTIGGHSVDVVGFLGWKAADGDWSIDLSGVGAGSLRQTFDTQAGTTYRVSFEIGGNFYGSSSVKTGTASVGDTVLQLSFDNSGSTVANMGWQSRSFDFTAAGPTSTLQFVSGMDSANGLALDNVRVTAVPEPQTMALWLAGLAALSLRRRR